jgi:hypothetical protein
MSSAHEREIDGSFYLLSSLGGGGLGLGRQLDTTRGSLNNDEKHDEKGKSRD